MAFVLPGLATLMAIGIGYYAWLIFRTPLPSREIDGPAKPRRRKRRG